MAETTIEWTRGPNGEPGFTFNPWEGCQKVGPGCDNCYAEARNARFGGGQAINWGPDAPRRRTSAGNWHKPRQWNAQAEREGRRYRVFCASLADVFDNEVPDYWRADLFELIAATPNLDWLLLTKRIGNAARMLPPYMGGDLVPNVWLGATVVNQEEVDRDVPKLLAVPARVRFLSIEPMLGPISFEGMFANPHRINEGTNALEALDWVIAGGESGPHARPAHPDWFRSLRDQCAATDVPFLFKQWGEWLPEGQRAAQAVAPDLHGRRWCTADDGDDRYTSTAAAVHKVGKKAAGRLLDGVAHDGFPEVR